MTKRLILIPVLALALACGGSDSNSNPEPEPWTPPVVDPLRVEDLCPAPEVPIMLGYGYCDESEMVNNRCPSYPTKLAGDLQVGDAVQGGFSWPYYATVADVSIQHNAQRLRLILRDGGEMVFTPNHVFQVGACDVVDETTVALPDNLRWGGFVELQYLVPGVCLQGMGQRVVADVVPEPDGDVVLISLNPTEAWPYPYQIYFAGDLMSVAHNSTAP